MGMVGCGKTTASPPAETRQPTPRATAAPDASVGAPPAQGSAAPERPGDDDSFAVSSEVAAKVGGLGFRLSGLRGRGWSRGEPAGRVLFQVNGPPGGSLGFEVHANPDGVSGPEPVEKLFTDAVTHRPVRVGKLEKARLAGAERWAQSFRTGEGFASTTWCVVKIPSPQDAPTGLLVFAQVTDRSDAEPSCTTPLRADAIAPLVASFALE